MIGFEHNIRSEGRLTRIRDIRSLRAQFVVDIIVIWEDKYARETSAGRTDGWEPTYVYQPALCLHGLYRQYSHQHRSLIQVCPLFQLAVLRLNNKARYRIVSCCLYDQSYSRIYTGEERGTQPDLTVLFGHTTRLPSDNTAPACPASVVSGLY
jgi:hypothetical protein